MAQFSIDFEQFAVGTDLYTNGFTARWGKEANYTFTVQDDATVGKHAHGEVAGATVADNVAASWDEPGLVADVEILLLCRRFDTVGGTKHESMGAISRGAGLATSKTGYLGLYGNSATQAWEYVYRSDGSFAQLANVAHNIADTLGEWLWVRFRCNGSTQQGRFWTYGGTEPSTWLYEVTNADITDSGWVGLFLHLTETDLTFDYAYIGVGTAGDPAPELVVGTTLVINDIAHAQSLDSPAVTQQHQLAANDITHAQTLDSPTLSTVADLVINDVSHSQTLDSPSLTQVHSLSVQDISQSQTLDSISITQAHQLVVNDISQSQTLDPVVLTTEDSLAVADISHGQTLDTVSLTQVHTLSIAELTHAQSLDSVTITTQQDLLIADLSQAQSLDSVTLSTGTAQTYEASAVILLQAQIPIEATIIDGNLDNSVAIIAGVVSASDTVEAAVTPSSQVDASVIPNSEVQGTVKQSDQLEAELL